VTYYHAIEANISEEQDSIPPLSQATRAALDEAWKRVLRSESEAKNVITSFQIAANNAGKSFSQLALEVGLSGDVLSKLEHHMIDAPTIPYELSRRLARALRQPLEAVISYMGLAGQQRLAQGIAEAPASNQVNEQSNAVFQTQSFQAAVERSLHLSKEQKLPGALFLRKKVWCRGGRCQGTVPNWGEGLCPAASRGRRVLENSFSRL
jgi:hypothetical protein